LRREFSYLKMASSGAAQAWQPIQGFRQDDEAQWVAQFACGHGQHVRHDPPWQNRPWTQTAGGRAAQIGMRLRCMKCERGEPVFRLADASFANSI
jgi:Protein of unknown function (DUF3565)